MKYVPRPDPTPYQPMTRRQIKQLNRANKRERKVIAKVLKQEPWDRWPWWFQIDPTDI